MMFLSKLYGGCSRLFFRESEYQVGKTSESAIQRVYRALINGKGIEPSTQPKVKIVSYKEAEKLADDNFNRRIREASLQRMAKEKERFE
jgi:hypothetical protein